MARASLKLHADREHLKLKLEKKRLEIRRAEDKAKIAELQAKIVNTNPKKPTSSS